MANKGRTQYSNTSERGSQFGEIDRQSSKEQMAETESQADS